MPAERENKYQAEIGEYIKKYGSDILKEFYACNPDLKMAFFSTYDVPTEEGNIIVQRLKTSIALCFLKLPEGCHLGCGEIYFPREWEKRTEKNYEIDGYLIRWNRTKMRENELGYDDPNKTLFEAITDPKNIYIDKTKKTSVTIFNQKTGLLMSACSKEYNIPEIKLTTENQAIVDAHFKHKNEPDKDKTQT